MRPKSLDASLMLPDRAVDGTATLTADGSVGFLSDELDAGLLLPPSAYLALASNALVEHCTLKEKVAIQTSGETGRLRLQPLHDAVLLRESLAAASALAQAGTDRASTMTRLRQLSNEFLTEQLREFFPALSDHLFDLSSRPHRRLSRDALHAGMSTLRKRGAALSKQMIDALSLYFADYTPAPEQLRDEDRDEYDLENLGLVDLAEFEEHLAIERVIRTGESQYHTQLEELTLRVAVLLAVNPLALRLPVHVAQLCQAFRSTLSDLGLASDVLIEVQDFFAANVIDQLDQLYHSLNDYLNQLGVFPDLHSRLHNEGSLLARVRAQQQSKSTRDTVTATRAPPPDIPLAETGSNARDLPGLTLEEAARQLATPPLSAVPNSNGISDVGAEPRATGSVSSASTGPEALYAAVVRALEQQSAILQAVQQPAGPASGEGVNRNFGQPASGTGMLASGAGSASAEQLSQALQALQGSKTVSSGLRDSEGLAAYLSAHPEALQDRVGNQGFDPHSQTQIALVDRLFGTLRTDLHTAAPLQGLLDTLHVPLARLALSEPQFFVQRDHSARVVIDKLAELSAAANYPNRPLETRVREIVQRIVTTYKDDSSVFASALEEIETLAAQQQRALERNVQRVYKTYQGQEKLQIAQLAAQAALGARVRPPRAARVLVDLVEKGWRDLLVLSHLKGGSNGKLWRACIKALDVLVLWLLSEQHDTDASRTTARRAEAAVTIDLMEQQQQYSLPANTALSAVFGELRDILARRLPIEHADLPGLATGESTNSKELRERIDTLPRLRRWVRRVEDLQCGTWLSYRDSRGHRRRMQLAWIANNKDRYIFVDERGQKHADMSAVQLARQLSHGVKPPTPAEQMSLVDQSMYDTLEQVQRHLSFARNYDRLTHLINADTLRAHLKRALAHTRRRQTRHALLYLDIDRFSLVNELYEAQAGDDVLMEFGRLLAQIHDNRITSARLHDDEFALLLLNCRANEDEELARSLCEAVAASPIEIDGEAVTFTVSIGIAAIVDYVSTVDDLLDNARTAMLQVKRRGGNGHGVFRESDAQRLALENQRESAEAEVAKALDTRRFVLQAQPIYRSVEWGSVQAKPVAYEMLLRIRADDDSLQSPAEFIAVAEQYGYMRQVDRWVVDASFAWITKQVDQGFEVPLLALNISGNSVSDDAFLDHLLNRISEYGVGTNRLCFEITEAGTISNLVKAADFVRTLRNIGCKFSVDDFGTGIDSHAYLRDLPVDFVKIDGSFVTAIQSDSASLAMTQAINDMAHFMGRQTIAEFVENERVADRLVELGVDMLQGWGIEQPLSLEKLAGRLEAVQT